MTQHNLTYPALCLAQDGSIVPHFSAETLGQCNARALWANRYYERLLVIDADARFWRVVVAEPEPALEAFDRALARMFNRSLRVRLSLAPDHDHTGIDDAHDTLADWLARVPDFWEAAADLDEWNSSIAACSTVEELTLIFA